MKNRRWIESRLTVFSLSPTTDIKLPTNPTVGERAGVRGLRVAGYSPTSNQPLRQLSIPTIQPTFPIKAQRGDNQGQYPAQVLQHIVIRHSNNLPASCPNLSFASLVVYKPPRMAVAIDFDDEMFSHAGEVDEIGTDGELPAEFQPQQFSVT